MSFVHLRTHSHYSFLDGASSIDDLLDAAVEQGQDALALTDTNGLYGAVRFWNAARARGVKPIFGAELRLVDGDPVTILAMDRTGWTSLCRIVSAAQLAGQKTKPRATFTLIAPHAAAFANARVIADRCVLDLGFGYQRLPGFSVPDGHTAFSFLYTLCQDGARAKYGGMTPAVSKQLAHELDVIHRCGLAEFFLINWDIVPFCNQRRIPPQGPASAPDPILPDGLP